MAYAKLYDDFCDHPKVIAAGNEVAGSMARLMSYAARHGTDGQIPPEILRAYSGRPKIARRLISESFLDVFDAKTGEKLTGFDPKHWRKKGVFFVVHNFLRYNLSAKEWEQKRESARFAGRKGADARWKKPYSEKMADPDPDPDPFSSSSQEPKIAKKPPQTSQNFPDPKNPAGYAVADLEPLAWFFEWRGKTLSPVQLTKAETIQKASGPWTRQQIEWARCATEERNSARPNLGLFLCKLEDLINQKPHRVRLVGDPSIRGAGERIKRMAAGTE